MRESGTHAQTHTFCDGARAQAHTSVPVRVHRRTVCAGARGQSHCVLARVRCVPALVRRRSHCVLARVRRRTRACRRACSGVQVRAGARAQAHTFCAACAVPCRAGGDSVHLFFFPFQNLLASRDIVTALGQSLSASPLLTFWTR